MNDRHIDLDALLASAASDVRPTAAFEEDLLLRLEDELGSGSSEPSIDVDPIPIPQRAGRERRPVRPMLARAAAAIVVLGLAVGLALSISSDPETVQTGLPEPAVEVLAEACRTHLPVIGPYAIEGTLSGSDTGWQATIVADLSGASDGLDAALRTGRELLVSGPVAPDLVERTDGLIDTAHDIGDFLADELELWDAGFRDQARTSLPLVANRLADLATDIASLGVPACEPPN
ncbi:MAG: hypothetical protein AAF480_08565 [Actinomycetota bacterium]